MSSLTSFFFVCGFRLIKQVTINIYIYINACNMYVWSHIHIAKSMDQSGKVANPARGQLNRET